jgi:YD repeat-containing protein
MGMGPVWRCVAAAAVALCVGSIWTAAASAVQEGSQGCPGSAFQYLREFRFPVATEGFADDCTLTVGTAIVDARTGAVQADVRVDNGLGDGVAVDSQGRLTHFAAESAGVFDLVHPTGVIGSITVGGTRSTLKYNSAGRLTQIVAAGGNTSVSYNVAGLISAIASPSFSESFGYSTVGRLRSFSDNGGDKASLTYDASGRLTKLVQVFTAADPTETFSYDAGGNVLTWSTTDTLTRTLAFTHDSHGDVTLVKDGANTDATLAYTPSHKLSAVTGPGNSPVASFTYDTSGRLSGAQGPSSTVTFSYNGAGLLASMQAGSLTTSFSYDALGRLTGWTNPDMSTAAIAYLPGPVATTGGPISVRSNTATVTGRVNPHGAPTAYHFQYGLTTGYGHATPSVTLSAATSAISVVDGIHDLRPDTTYHYRVLASNRNGSSTGLDRTFHTQPLRCRVPKLEGDTLRQAKRALKRAHCRLGRVHRPHHVPHGAHLEVSRQSPSAGAVRPQGTKVAVKLSVAH